MNILERVSYKLNAIFEIFDRETANLTSEEKEKLKEEIKALMIGQIEQF